MSNTAQDKPALPVMAPTPKPTPTPTLGPDPCQSFASSRGEPPIWLRESGFMVTRFVKTCTTREGQPGYDHSSPWTAMGIPCTGGGGRMEWKGYLAAPKLLSFHVATDCPMLPASIQQVSAAGKAAFGLNDSAKLVAYNPLAVQYWEIDGYPEADTGFTIEFRSNAGLTDGWNHFRNGHPLRVHLFGRENAWVPGDQFYQVDADMLQTGKALFRLNVVSAKLLSKPEVEAVKSRCENLRPRRSCGEVF